jgi:MFS transporter, DHA1 family, tetracycline resistance protein
MRGSLPVLFVVSCIDVLGFGVLVPLVPYMATRFGAAPDLVTAILGSYSLCQFIAAPLWGRLSDRFGRRPILMSSLAGACLSYALLAVAQGLGMLLASRMLAGFMAGNLSAAFAYASDVSAPEQRAKSMGVVGAAIGIGFMLGIPLGGLLAGDSPQHANFLAPAVASMALSLTALALVKFLLPESRAPEARAAPSERTVRPWQLLRTRPALREIAGAALLVTCAQGVLESIFALWALGRFQAGPRDVGLALFGVAFLSVLMQGGLVRTLAPRLGEARLGSAGALTYACGLLVVSLSGRHLPWIGFGLALAGLGMGAFTPSAAALASKQARGDDRGAVMGTYQASTSLARVIGPFASGVLYRHLGPDAPFLTAAALALPAAWLLWHAVHGGGPAPDGALIEGSRSRRS